ncbi:MAG TPA: TerC/Alx family metal homeostasis membrane protein [Flavisolibacter sp.]|nr:TerC/Alx family metal homeostasis membrane protein [Flavisolibacter sp.]
MTVEQITYVVFACVVVSAVVLDLRILSKSSIEIDVRKALLQTISWVSLALLFWVFLFFYRGSEISIKYITAYLMEWSLSIDNIFVFILIFTFFNIRKDHVARALLIGILLAIFLRIIFITVGVALVNKFEWILYIFGGFLVYSGIKLFYIENDEKINIQRNWIYRLFNHFIPVIHEDISGKFLIRKNGKRFFTNLFLVVVLLATTDVVFALDSIPAVFAISQDKLVIYTSNIFAVLGLRSLYFLLKGAVNRFEYLQQGIAIILLFVGIKMLLEIFHVKIKDYISLIIIIICLFGSISYSVRNDRRNLKK